MEVTGITGDHFTKTTTMTKNKNFLLPSVLTPALLSTLFLIANNRIEGLLIGFILYYLISFIFVNVFGWIVYLVLVRMKIDTYFACGITGGIVGAIIFFMLSPSFHYEYESFLKSFDFVPYGVIAGIVFRILVYWGRRD